VPTGGAAAVAGMVQRCAAVAAQPDAVAGDLIGRVPLVSTLFKHESTIEVMNKIASSSTPRQHEFDAGITELKRIARAAAHGAADEAVASCGLERTAARSSR